MKYLSKSRMWSKLLEKYPNEFGGWFTNGLDIHFGDNCIYLSNRVHVHTLIWRTQRILSALDEEYPLYAFPDLFAAGWRNEVGRRRTAPIEISDETVLKHVIENKMFFREGPIPRYEDNYHITNKDMTWFVVFCHHDNWFFFASPNVIEKVRIEWKTMRNRKTGVLDERGTKRRTR